ncbi:TIGR01777 family oxidoreductase [Raineyella sp. LH-20]|uniref:TIGR01777 family oxidoreductase n=1 Tax=Raineyella sp. LH-20 TaxID=3081204 RepID=UPI0029534E5C|nr:TIGR01777 family oxidoreductase [Raineyella sp. LH-20]WOP20008.1 TIGR01777 family oxidoreductase [Raineyella sp. LH-20]
MTVFEHTATYPHPRDEVFAWHERPGAFVRLSPPGAIVTVDGPSDGLHVGSRRALRISSPLLTALWPGRTMPSAVRTGPGLRWLVEHVAYESGRLFVDEQVRGPLRHWRHEHLFEDAEGGGTRITDRVTYELPPALAGSVGERWMHRYLEGLFRFREDQLRADLALHQRLARTPRTIAIAGASGTIGTQLTALLATGGHTVLRLVRRPAQGTDEISWAPELGDLDPARLAGVDTVVNLSGRPIVTRYTPTTKHEILWSRLDATQTLTRAIVAARRAGDGPAALVQANAVGYYGGRRPGEVLTEDSPAGTDFLADVARQWEEASHRVAEDGARLVVLRTGTVLGPAAGMLAMELPLFLVGAGGRLTSPQAMVSWIGLDDITRAYAHVILEGSCRGPYNAVAPGVVTAGAFASRLGEVLHRPSLIPTPGFGPALLLGREAAAILVHTDLNVSSARLRTTGFRFSHPELVPALRHALTR